MYPNPGVRYLLAGDHPCHALRAAGSHDVQPTGVTSADHYNVGQNQIYKRDWCTVPVFFRPRQTTVHHACEILPDYLHGCKRTVQAIWFQQALSKIGRTGFIFSAQGKIDRGAGVKSCRRMDGKI